MYIQYVVLMYPQQRHESTMLVSAYNYKGQSAARYAHMTFKGELVVYMSLLGSHFVQTNPQLSHVNTVKS